MITPRARHLLLVIAVLLACASLLPAQRSQKSDEPAMGVDPEKIVHHFYLLKNGGAIEISAKDDKDADVIAAIQRHIAVQAKAFEKGNFDTPTLVHEKQPEGVPVIRKLRKEITFEVVPTDAGAALRMLSVNSQARQAIHDFLRFQIEEHKTGDPTTVEQ